MSRKMKLERKHIIPYLDYRLKFKDYYSEQVIEIIGISKVVNADKTINEDAIILYLNSDETILIDQSRFQLTFKPILLPLSDLTKLIEIDGVTFNPYDYWAKKVVSKEQWSKICETISDEYCKIMDLPAWCVNLLYMWHFDVAGLIDKGLAIDINTIE